MRLIMTTINTQSRRGVTILELMVVFAIMGFLATVGVPKFFGVAEKTREKVDLMKLYYLRDALNKALIEDLDAFSKYTPTKESGATSSSELSKLDAGLGSDQGASLFVIELHNAYTINVQGSHDQANNKAKIKDNKGKVIADNQDINICKMIGNGGTWYNALNEARFEGVADIIAARLAKTESKGGATFTSVPYTKGSNTYYRTAPIQPIFISQSLNSQRKKLGDNLRYTMSIHWTPGQEGYSVEVYLLPHQDKNKTNSSTWETSAYKTDHGVCFSTLGRKGCKNSQ